MPINIQIGKNLYLKSDSTQFILYEKIENKKDIYQKVLGYYATLNEALNWSIWKHIGRSNITSLQDILVEINNLKTYIDLELKKIFPDLRASTPRQLDKFLKKPSRKRTK